MDTASSRGDDIAEKPKALTVAEAEILEQNVLTTEPDYKYLSKIGVSENCIDLVRKLLIKDPKERLSMNRALKQPWFGVKSIESNT